MAVEDIVNEAIVVDSKASPVEIDLDGIDQPDEIKKKIQEEFDGVLNLLNFQNMCYDIFRRWFVDGRLYYHIMVSETKPREGIKELRYIDPRRIRKVREPLTRNPITAISATNPKDVKIPAFQEYYYYKPQIQSTIFPGMNQTVVQSELRVSADAICYTHSGFFDTRNTLVLSHLHKAIKPMNQLRTMEDAVVIYRLARAPERRVFYIDVGNMPKLKAEQHMNEIMTRNKNRLVYDAKTGEIRDDRKFMCYALDTKIPLLDGRTLTLQDLIAEHKAGKKNWVYSCNSTDGKFVPGPVSWAGITKKNADVVRVTFDNGKSIVCTPDHKFPVWDKGLVEAKDLVGESVIPGYRRQKAVWKNGPEYEQIYKNDTKTWEFTHREVARWKDDEGLREEFTHNAKYADAVKNTIHHKNYKHTNNDPANLVRMHRYDHMHYHRDCAKFGFGRRTNTSEDFTQIWRTRLSESAKRRVPVCKSWKIRTPDGAENIIENLNAFCRVNNLNRCNIKERYGSRGYHAELLRNHKAITVEWLSEKIDVGCLAIDADETYHSHHTYLLDVGVYTKNTMLEDFYLARREGGKGTEITTLAGGLNLGEMTDVEYFKKRLYKALHVPVSRMESDGSFNLGRASEITRDELKFAKFIQRLRLRFSHIFDNLLEIQLSLKGVMRRSDWQAIRNDVRYNFQEDNFFAESKMSEIMATRLATLQGLQGQIGVFYSKEWVRRNVLMMSEDDIKDMKQQINDELKETAKDNEKRTAMGLPPVDATGMPMPPMMGDPGMGGDPNAPGGDQGMGLPMADPGVGLPMAQGVNRRPPKPEEPENRPFTRRSGKGKRVRPSSKNEEFVPAEMSEDDRQLIANMTKALNQAAVDIRDDL